MAFDLFVVAVLYALGLLVFGHFERHLEFKRRALKVSFMFGTTALLSSAVGHWSLLFVVGMFGLGVAVHFWWTITHGIHPVTAEPKAKYYALRGWALENL